MRSTLRGPLILALVSALTGAGVSAGSAATGGANPPIATVPAVGSRASSEPSSVTLAMRDAVTGPAVVTVKDPSGRVVSEGQTTLLSTNIAVDLKPGLARGVYTVTYRIEGSKTKGPEGGVFQFAYGSGNPRGTISTWSGYKAIPKEARLPDDAKRQAAFEAASNDDDQPSATPRASDSTDGADPSTSADVTDEPDNSDGSVWWWVIAALALGSGGVAGFVAYRRRGRTDTGERISPAPDPDEKA